MSKKVKIYDSPVFAERFRTLMGKRNITLRDISELTGCAVSTASTWRRGRLPRSEETLEKIAKFFGVDIFYLSGRDITIFSNENQNFEIGEMKKLLKLKFDNLLKKSAKNKSNLLIIKNTLEELAEKITQ